MKEVNVAALDLSHKIQMIEHIFDNMHIKHTGLDSTGYLLGGDTGVGKTSFIRDLAALLGLELVIIETPHIVEEHIIDIPFIVVKPAGDAKNAHLQVDTASPQFDIKFAKSNLYVALTRANKMDDAALLRMVNSKQHLMPIWKELGGDEDVIPEEIMELRKKYKVILFLDEYFRQTSNAIRNMLRSILNGRIGSNEIPPDVYVIFASNLVDQGVGDIMENEDFRILDFDKPSLDGWFSYMFKKHGVSDK